MPNAIKVDTTPYKSQNKKPGVAKSMSESRLSASGLVLKSSDSKTTIQIGSEPLVNLEYRREKPDGSNVDRPRRRLLDKYTVFPNLYQPITSTVDIDPQQQHRISRVLRDAATNQIVLQQDISYKPSRKSKPPPSQTVLYMEPRGASESSQPLTSALKSGKSRKLSQASPRRSNLSQKPTVVTAV